jgi:hypothetical protein
MIKQLKLGYEQNYTYRIRAPASANPSQAQSPVLSESSRAFCNGRIFSFLYMDGSKEGVMKWKHQNYPLGLLLEKRGINF